MGPFDGAGIPAVIEAAAVMPPDLCGCAGIAEGGQGSLSDNQENLYSPVAMPRDFIFR